MNTPLVQNDKSRILYLDGLRCIAITLVIGYHYFSRWTISSIVLYPYGDIWSNFMLFRWGHYGVELFFIVSGFVITMTLKRCESAPEFALRRFSRLYPPMALCCAFTFFIIAFVPGSPFTASVKNFVPSLMIVDPGLLNSLFGTQFDWMDGAYWSLWVEIRFYALMAIVYFYLGGNFERAVNIVITGILATSAVFALFGFDLATEWLNSVAIADYLAWFAMGIGFYFLHFERRKVTFLYLVLISMAHLILLSRLAGRGWLGSSTAVLIPTIFLCAGAVPIFRKLLSSQLISRIGQSSYSLYLIHQFAGITLITWIGNMTGFSGRQALPIAFAVGSLLALLSIQIYLRFEHPMNRLIINKFLKTHKKQELEGSKLPSMQ